MLSVKIYKELHHLSSINIEKLKYGKTVLVKNITSDPDEYLKVACNVIPPCNHQYCTIGINEYQYLLFASTYELYIYKHNPVYVFAKIQEQYTPGKNTPTEFEINVPDDYYVSNVFEDMIEDFFKVSRKTVRVTDRTLSDESHQMTIQLNN